MNRTEGSDDGHAHPTSSHDAKEKGEGGEGDGEQLTWPLLEAVKREDLASVHTLVRKHGVRSQRPSPWKRSEAHALARVQKQGPRLMQQEGQSSARRWWSASVPDQVKLWDLLFEAGADVEEQDEEGRSAFHELCLQGNLAVITHLIQHGHVRNLDHTDGRQRGQEGSSGGESGLHHAARAGHADVVELLVEYGADMNLEGPQGIPSDVAREAGHHALAERMEHMRFNQCPLLAVPLDVMVLVLRQLEPNDLCSIAQTCRRLNEASSTNSIWSRFCDPQSAGRRTSDGSVPSSFKATYMGWLRPRLKHYAYKTCVGSLRKEEPVPASPAQLTQYDYRMKVVLLGGPGVGLTSMVHRFVRDEFLVQMEARIGAAFIAHTIKLSDGGPRIRMEMWDGYKGGSRYSLPGTLLLRGTHIVCLAYDITQRRTFEHMAWMLQEIVKVRSTDCLIMLVGTKIDLAEKREVQEKEVAELADQYAIPLWMEVSSRTGEGVREAFESGLREVMGRYRPFYDAGMNWVPSEDILQSIAKRRKKTTRVASSADGEKAHCSVQ